MADSIRSAPKPTAKVIVSVLMSHEMETGQRKDTAGKLVPARYIQEVTATPRARPC